MNAEELKHHGIKGQKWGVRRYQNKDGSLTKAGMKRYKNEINSNERRIKTGTELQNITSDKYDHNKTSRLYTSYTDYDKAEYIDLMGNFMYDGRGYTNTFVVKKDIRVASDKQVVDAFVSLAKSNPEQVSKDMASAYNQVNLFMRRTEKYYNKRLSDIESISDNKKRKLAEEFVETTILSDTADKSNKNFYAHLVSKGFDAISDTNDRKSDAQDPLIILNLDTIELKGSVKLTNEDLEHFCRYIQSSEHRRKRYDHKDMQR